MKASKVWLAPLAAIAFALLAAGGTGWFFYCPCDRTAGGWLLGNEAPEPIKDWSFANKAGLCQIQVAGVLPHSVNLNCMAADGELFLSCARCDGKTWSTHAIADPDARIRIAGTLYPVTLARVTNNEDLDRAWLARATKLGRQVRPRQEGWWSFRVASR
jgi:hypothetical protein